MNSANPRALSDLSGIYAVEMTARVYVFRMDVFRTGMLFDFLIAGNSAETKQELLIART